MNILVETIKSHYQLNLDLAFYYRYVFQTQDAILDYTRVIHMRPDVSDYHMARVSEILTSSSFQFNNLGGEEKKVLLNFARSEVTYYVVGNEEMGTVY